MEQYKNLWYDPTESDMLGDKDRLEVDPIGISNSVHSKGHKNCKTPGLDGVNLELPRNFISLWLFPPYYMMLNHGLRGRNIIVTSKLYK